MFHPRGPTLRELLVQALSSTDRGYDLLAPKFEYTPFRTPDEVLRVAAAELTRTGPVERVLDLCCGTGAAMRALRSACTRQLAGVDRSRGMLAQAHRLLAATEGVAEVTLVRGDVLALPFAQAFDVVTCFGAFGHILEEDEPRLVAAIAGALRPGGRFVFATGEPISPLRPAWWIARGFNAAMRVRNFLLKPEFVMYYLTFLAPRARALLEAAGFEVQLQRGVFPPPYQRLVLGIATRPR